MPEVTMAQARAALAARLSPGALAHCERVSAEAARVANAYGLDDEAAALAGLLHDWSRDMDDPELLATAERLDVPVAEADEARPYLLHARVGAAELRGELPDLAEDVIEAVAAHTLGEIGMDELAMAVYVADMIEPERNWPGVDDLRGAVGEVELAELLLRAMTATFASVIERRKPLHPHAVAVWNSMVGR